MDQEGKLSEEERKKRAKEEAKIDDTLYGLFLFLNTIVFVLIALILISFWIRFSLNQALTIVATFLSISGAYLFGGAIIGFLFAIPRSGTYRYKAGKENNDSWYDDNTNLEEISDWLTKIIVGITLIQFDKILHFIDLSARSISSSFLGDCQNGCQYYSWAYGLIVFFIAIGFVISYLWTRINFALILTVSRKRINDISKIEKQREQSLQDLLVIEEQKKQLETEVKQEEQQLQNLNEDRSTMITAVSSAASKNAVEIQPDVFSSDNFDSAIAAGDGASEAFKLMVAERLSSKPVTVKDDLQKDRWGGITENNGKKIEGYVKESKLYSNFFDIRVRVSSTDTTQPLTGWVAFFVHDTFGFKNDTVYAKANEQGFAEIPLVAYEAFTIGALTEDGTELEIDLNDQPGFPEDFYWK